MLFKIFSTLPSVALHVNNGELNFLYYSTCIYLL